MSEAGEHATAELVYEVARALEDLVAAGSGSLLTLVEVETFVESLPFGVLIATGTGILGANAEAARLLGFSTNPDSYVDLVGLTANLLVRYAASGESVPAEALPMSVALGGRFAQEELLVRRVDSGTDLLVHCEAAPILRRDHVIGAVAILGESRASNPPAHPSPPDSDVEPEPVIALLRELEAQRFLNEATMLLASSLDYRETLRGLARLVAERFADICSVFLVDPNGSLEVLENTVREPRTPQLEEDAASVLQGRAPDGPLARAIQGESILLRDVPNDLVVGSGQRSTMYLPLRVRDRTLGVMALLSRRRRYDDEDLALAQVLAFQCAFAIDNALAYEEARRATRMSQEVLAVVSHDLRNLLNVVQFGAHSLRLSNATSDAERIGRHTERIHRAAQQMSRLIRDLLEWSCIEAGRLTIDTQEHQLSRLLTDALEMFEPLAAEKSIALTLDDGTGGEELRLVPCDRDRIMQVFSNLIGNAIKFTQPGGVICLRARVRGEAALLSVEDNGPGISEHELPHVFDRYWQAKKRGRQGVGLGLAIARGIVDAHGGSMWAESNLGAGSTFSFTLPFATRAGR